jgi:tripartite-type tricarboxylate transporter receptor subunit TctC
MPLLECRIVIFGLAMKPFLSYAAVVAAALGAAATAHAQAYPARPIRLVVSFAAGGGVDLVARLVGQKLAEAWGQQVVIDNRPGAGGNLSAELVARAPADGYTLYMSSASIVVNASLYKSLPYDPLKDFAPVTLLVNAHNVLVAHPSLPAKNIRELVALAKKAPGQINYASTGSGSSGHLAMELFRSMAGIELTHIPYKVIGQTTADLLSGQVSLWFPTMPGVLQHIHSGRMRALGVSGSRRTAALPAVPTIAEAGVAGYEASTWYPLLAPAATPPAVIEKLQAQMSTILAAADVREKLQAQGMDTVGSTPAQLAAHLQAELAKWARVVRLSGARAD